MFRRILRIAVASATAGGAIYLATAYTIRPPGVDKTTAGALRFVPGSPGYGIDDVWLGLVGGLGFAAGNMLGHAFLGKGR